MSQNPEMPLPVNATPNLTTCSNCHSAMPSELRFCRNCGFRLGEGIAEYTETVRFGDQRGPLVPGSVSAPVPVKKRRKMSGMAWVFVGLLIFFIGAAAFTAIISPMRGNRVGIVQTPKDRSYAGVRDWDTVDNGVTFTSVTPPEGPADKAGLVGGDVITTFDGQPIHNEDEMTRALTRTPIGKTVDVVYLRDGETRTTKMTTVSERDLESLSEAFDDREDHAQLGIDRGSVKRVEIPGTKIYGVQLNRILGSRPADIAGVRDGDIIVQWDDIPIRTPQELLSRINRAFPYTTVNLTIMRGEEKLTIPVKMGKE
jgi:membrane-associated protease RseP (regulator of RpoE activity)